MQGVEDFEDLKEVYLPIMYVYEGFEVPEDVTNQYKDSLAMVDEVQSVYYYAGQAVGVLLLLCAFVAAVHKPANSTRASARARARAVRPTDVHTIAEQAPLLTNQ